MNTHLLQIEQSYCVKTDKQKASVDANICAFALVGRIMKKALPDNAKLSNEAKVCVQRCTSEFISFITSEACEKTVAEKRKAVNAEDILSAMKSLGVDNYAEVLGIYLSGYRERTSSGHIMPNEAGNGGALGQELACGEGSVEPGYMSRQHVDDDSITDFSHRE
ncbi:Transcriptional activator hap3 [Metarhizium anisopliae]|nr:Transcriptional activator hap3 [Metarhizium anisopliae]